MLLPRSHQPSVTTSDRQKSAPVAPSAPGSVQDTPVALTVEELVPTPRPFSPVGEDTVGPPPVVQSFSSSLDEAVAGPSRASPLDDFKEHQAVLRRLALNLGLQGRGNGGADRDIV